MGYLRGLTHGAIAGAILALLYAPESGVNMRRRVSRLLGQAEQMMAAESGGVRRPARGWRAGGAGGGRRKGAGTPGGGGQGRRAGGGGRAGRRGRRGPGTPNRAR